jgi:hypothetical protein
MDIVCCFYTLREDLICLPVKRPYGNRYRLEEITDGDYCLPEQ